MAVKLVPYNNAMRLGQGFNSYTQQICIDDAVVVDPGRAENVVTNDGTTMRIIAQRSALPSAWSRQPEVVTDKVSDNPMRRFKLKQYAEEFKEADDNALKDQTATDDDPENGDANDEPSEEEDPEPQGDGLQPDDSIEEPDPTTGSVIEDTDPDANADTTENDNQGGQQQVDADDSMGGEVVLDDDSGEHIMSAELDEPAQVAGIAAVDDEAEEHIEEVTSDAASTAPEAAEEPSNIPDAPKSAELSSPVPVKSPVSKPTSSQIYIQRAVDKLKAEEAKKREEEKEQQESRKKEQEELRKAEAKRIEEQRHYDEEEAREAREDERARRKEEREERRQIRIEKRDFDAKRRANARDAIEAASKKDEALGLEEMKRIAARNQFAERFSGMLGNERQYTFDATGARGPSQTVTYTSRFVERLSDVTEDMCISGSLSIKAGKIGGSGKGSFVDSDKFKESDLNFYISVKVVNQTVNFKDALIYNPVSSVTKDNFKQVFGDSFISGFVEGGEFNAIVSMKILNKAKKTDIQAEAKVALTTGSVNVDADANVGIARANLETNTETTIQVAWSGGGHIKPMEQQWDINSLMEAAARFPDLVADCPQRIYAVLTKYETLRSFLTLKPAGCSPLQYENARIYTNALLDYYMSYKTLYKQLGEQIFGVDAGTLEFCKDSAAQPSTTSTATANNEDNKKVEKDETNKKDEKTGLYPYVEDRTPFQQSIEGLSDARIAIRRQMARIVNEVDLIENAPAYATDEDHKEPFQTPIAFAKRIPKVALPERLQRHSLPLSGQAITNKVLTEPQQLEELRKQAELDGTPYLFRSEDSLTIDEKNSLNEIRNEQPGIGLKFRVTGAVGSLTKGDVFNNLDLIKCPGVWDVISIKVHIFKGFVSYVGVEYRNGSFFGKGVKHNTANSFDFGPFGPGERVISASIETGVLSTAADGKGGADSTNLDDEPRILAIGFFTNRGNSMIATARNEIKADNKFGKDGTTFEDLKVTYFDRPLENSTFKGFYGRSIDNFASGEGGIWKLGVIWGTTSDTTTTTTEVVPLGLAVTRSFKNDAHGPQCGRVGELSDWQTGEKAIVVRRSIEFDPAYAEPPLLISGIRHIDVNAHTGILATTGHMGVTRTKATALLRTLDNEISEFDMSWLSIPRTDKHIEAGVYEFVGDEERSESDGWVSYSVDVPFSMPFRTPPKTVNWLCTVDNVKSDDRWSASSSILRATSEAMTIQSSRLAICGSNLIGNYIGYFCYDPEECTNIQSGFISPNYKKGEERGHIKFEYAFKSVPVVFLAIRHFEATVQQHLRITGDVNNVQEGGFDYFCGSWDPASEHEMRQFGLIWIAVV